MTDKDEIEKVEQWRRDYCKQECPYWDESECWTNCPLEDEDDE